MARRTRTAAKPKSRTKPSHTTQPTTTSTAAQPSQKPNTPVADATRRSPAITGRAHSQSVTLQQVAERAYYIWLDQGKPCGMDHSHWFQAQQELTSAA